MCLRHVSLHPTDKFPAPGMRRTARQRQSRRNGTDECDGSATTRYRNRFTAHIGTKTLAVQRWVQRKSALPVNGNLNRPSWASTNPICPRVFTVIDHAPSVGKVVNYATTRSTCWASVVLAGEGRWTEECRTNNNCCTDEFQQGLLR